MSYRTTVVVICLMVVMGSCGSDRTTAVTRTRPLGRPAVTTRIGSVASHEGRSVVELPVGGRQGVRIGDFFRVYAEHDDHVLKGMIQITEIIDEEQSLGRVIAQHDRNDPPVAGDEARLVRDLRSLSRGDDIEREAREAERRHDLEDEAMQREITALRNDFRHRLAEAREAFDRELAAQSRAHEQELTEQRAAHQRAVSRLEAERSADLAALRVDKREQAERAIHDQRRRHQDELRALRRELAHATDQGAALLDAQQRLEERIRSLVADAAQAARRHRQEIEAEVETRRVLERRLAALEGRESTIATGSGQRSGEVGQDETILERLQRLEQERDVAHRRHAALVAEITQRDQDLAAARQQAEDLQKRLQAIADVDGDRERLAAQLAETSQIISELRDHARALEALRLQAERNSLDLARRILQINSERPAEVEQLQRHVRRQFQADENDAGGSRR